MFQRLLQLTHLSMDNLIKFLSLTAIGFRGLVRTFAINSVTYNNIISNECSSLIIFYPKLVSYIALRIV